MLDKIKSHITQPSTVRGIALLLALVGLPNAEEWVQHASTVIIGAIGIYDLARQGRSWGQEKPFGG